MASALGLPQDFILPTKKHICIDVYDEANTCLSSGGYTDYSTNYEYKSSNSGGQTSGGSNAAFDDPDLDDEYDHGFAYKFGFIENEYRDPSTRHTHEDFEGLERKQGIKAVTPPTVPHAKAHWNKKHITEEYDYRDKKRRKGIAAYPDNKQTIKRNNNLAKQEAYDLYLEIADRMIDTDGQEIPKSSRKDFFRVTTSETERFIADVVFNVTEGQLVGSRKYMMDSGSTSHLICWKYLQEQEKQHVRSCRPCILNTANGKVKVDKEVDIFIIELDIWIVAYILLDSPPILSVGKLCRQEGFVYVQNGAQDPVLYDNKFTQGTTLRIRNDVPFLLPELTSEPMNKTPVNSPRPNYNALTAQTEMQ